MKHKEKTEEDIVENHETKMSDRDTQKNKQWK